MGIIHKGNLSRERLNCCTRYPKERMPRLQGRYPVIETRLHRQRRHATGVKPQQPRGLACEEGRNSVGIKSLNVKGVAADADQASVLCHSHTGKRKPCGMAWKRTSAPQCGN